MSFVNIWDYTLILAVSINLMQYMFFKSNDKTDWKVYEWLRIDPTNPLMKRNNNLVNSCLNKHFFDKKTKYQLIISSIDSPTYALLKWFAKILSKVIANLNSNVNNAYVVVNCIKKSYILQSNSFCHLIPCHYTLIYRLTLVLRL